MSQRRRPLVAGNWKMNGLKSSAAEFGRMIDGASRVTANADLLVCPPATLVMACAAHAQAHGSKIAIGAQDCHSEASGAFTGDISAEMLADGGAVATGQAGSSSLPEFESDQLRIGLLTLDQGATYAVAAAKIPPLLVALDGTEAEGIVRVKIQGAAGTGTRPLRAGDVQEVPADLPYELHSTGGGPSRFLVIAPKD